MNCKQCGGIMKVDQDKRVFNCPFCGTAEPFDSVSKKELDKAINSIKKENRKMVAKIVEDNRKNMMAAKADSTAKDTLAIVLLTIFLGFVIILTAFAFDSGYYISGVVSSVQLVLIVLSLILRAAYKTSRNPRTSLSATIMTGIAGILVIVWFLGLAAAPDSAHNYKETAKEWPTIGMGSDLPEPGKTANELYNTDKYLSARIKNVDRTFFEEYVKKCREAGYNIDPVLDSYSYTAYNDKDDELVLSFFYDSELNITMNKALNFTEFYWPKSGGIQYLPEPKAEKICVESLSDTSARIYIGDVTKAYLLQYIEELKEAGFSGNYDDKKGSFYGKKDNVSVNILLKRDRIIYFDTYVTNNTRG